jgi:hypothetical protein
MNFSVIDKKKQLTLKTVYILISDGFFFIKKKCHKFFGMPFGPVTNILLTQKGWPSFKALFSLIDANDGFGSVIMKVNTFDVSLV